MAWLYKALMMFLIFALLPRARGTVFNHCSTGPPLKRLSPTSLQLLPATWKLARPLNTRAFLRTNALQRGFCRNTLASTHLKRQWPDRCARPYPSLVTCGIYRHEAERIGQTRRTLSLATSPFYEERQRFYRELLIRPKFCRSPTPQLRMRFIRLGY